jgi:large subunit ribosomal protein L9
MNIILQKDFAKLGSTGDMVTVKDGYARNFLIPQGIAIIADKSAEKLLAERKKVEELRRTKEKRNAEKLAELLAKISLTAKVQAGEEDRLFGAVTSQDIYDLIKEKGFDIDRRKIHLEEPIKTLGVYQIPLKLHPEVTVTVKLWVIKE